MPHPGAVPRIEGTREGRGAEQLLRLNEAFARLAVSRTKGYELLARGELAYVRVGADRRVTEAEIVSFVERNRVAARANSR